MYIKLYDTQWYDTQWYDHMIPSWFHTTWYYYSMIFLYDVVMTSSYFLWYWYFMSSLLRQTHQAPKQHNLGLMGEAWRKIWSGSRYVGFEDRKTLWIGRCWSDKHRCPVERATVDAPNLLRVGYPILVFQGKPCEGVSSFWSTKRRGFKRFVDYVNRKGQNSTFFPSEQWKQNPGCCGYIWDYTTQWCVGIMINHCKTL